MMTEEDQVELACAWSDYRKEYGLPSGIDSKVLHKFFAAGFKAGRDGDQSGVLR